MADAKPPPLVWANGAPMRREELAREVAGPQRFGVRQVMGGHPAQGLTPQRLARLLLDAEAGDATAYLELAEEMEEKDLHYQSVMGTRKRAVAQLPIEVEPAGESADEQADAQLVRDWLERDMLEAEIFDILDAIGKGYSCTELVWDTRSVPWLPIRCLWRPPSWFEFDPEDPEKLMLRDLGGPQPLSAAKYIVHFHKAKSGSPVRGGIARAAAWGYMFKNYAIKDWVAFLETYGMPYRVGRYDNGETEENIRKLMAAVADLGSDAAAVFPKSMDVEFVDTKAGTAPNDLWRAKAEYVDSQISKAVLGQTGTTDSKEGGLGDGGNKVHNDVRGDIERADAKLLAATLNRDLVVPLVALNRGPRKRYPRLKIGRPDEVDVEKMSRTLQILVPLGLKVSQEDVRERAGLPAPAEGAELLAPPQAAQQALPEPPGPDDTREAADPALRGLKSPARGQLRSVASGVAAEPASPDAIDDLTDEALGDWEELVTPLIEPVEQLLASASTLGEARALLTSAIDEMDPAAFTELLARGGFAARLAGDLDARGEA
ncbi:DUF935 domain-containing protein [Sphingomonas gilva]|nr:DUF935 domain-containing protein [Sphingomonas gilva]